jgi:hypothetical protein
VPCHLADPELTDRQFHRLDDGDNNVAAAASSTTAPTNNGSGHQHPAAVAAADKLFAESRFIDRFTVDEFAFPRPRTSVINPFFFVFDAQPK